MLVVDTNILSFSKIRGLAENQKQNGRFSWFSRIFLVKRTLLPWYNRNRRKSHLAVAKFEISSPPF